jgi:hypothetical protein
MANEISKKTHEHLAGVAKLERQPRVRDQVREAVSAAQKTAFRVVCETRLGPLDRGLEGQGRGRLRLVLLEALVEALDLVLEAAGVGLGLGARGEAGDVGTGSLDAAERDGERQGGGSGDGGGRGGLVGRGLDDDRRAAGRGRGGARGGGLWGRILRYERGGWKGEGGREREREREGVVSPTGEASFFLPRTPLSLPLPSARLDLDLRDPGPRARARYPTQRVARRVRSRAGRLERGAARANFLAKRGERGERGEGQTLVDRARQQQHAFGVN